MSLLSKTILPVRVCLNPSRKGTRKFWIFFSALILELGCTTSIFLSSEFWQAYVNRRDLLPSSFASNEAILILSFSHASLLLHVPDQSLFFHHLFSWFARTENVSFRFCSKDLDKEREPFLCFEDHKSCCSKERRLYKLQKPLQIKRVMAEYSKADLALQSLKTTKLGSSYFVNFCAKNSTYRFNFH